MRPREAADEEEGRCRAPRVSSSSSPSSSSSWEGKHHRGEPSVRALRRALLGVLMGNVVLWLWWACLPRGDLLPLMHCDSDEESGQGRLAVVVPFFGEQVARLVYNFKFWRRFPPCEQAPMRRPTDLLLYFDLDDPHEMELTRSVLEGYTDDFGWEPFRCFDSIRLVSANLTKQESATRPRWYDEVLRLLGIWNRGFGPPNQFYRLFESESLSQGYSHFLYMEPDTFPVKSNWASKVLGFVEEESSRQVWMRGSGVRYHSFFLPFVQNPSSSRFWDHMNGNAVYRWNSKCFRRFLMETKRRFTTFPYDLAIHYFRTSTNDMASALRHRFSFTSNIVNFSTASYSSLNLDDDTYLVHGKSVAREHGV